MGVSPCLKIKNCVRLIEKIETMLRRDMTAAGSDETIVQQQRRDGCANGRRRLRNEVLRKHRFPPHFPYGNKKFFKRSAYSTMEETDEWFEEKRALDVCMSYELLQLSCLHYV